MLNSLIIAFGPSFFIFPPYPSTQPKNVGDTSAIMYTETKEDMITIRDTLVNELEIRGGLLPATESLIDDYMKLFEIKESLVEDIRRRGVTYSELNVKGTELSKENPSVKLFINVNRQMLSILEKLGLNPGSFSGGSAKTPIDYYADL